MKVANSNTYPSTHHHITDSQTYQCYHMSTIEKNNIGWDQAPCRECVPIVMVLNVLTLIVSG